MYIYIYIHICMVPCRVSVQPPMVYPIVFTRNLVKVVTFVSKVQQGWSKSPAQT